MHPAPVFHEADEARLLAHLARYSFATIAAAPDGRPRVAHAPLVVRRTEAGLALDFHLARRNTLAPFVDAGFRAVAVSLGPDAYVSPDWYGTDDQVPTWNYASVEAEGPVRPLDEAETISLLDDLSAQEEGRLAPKPPWTRAKLTSEKFETLVRAIVGARLLVERRGDLQARAEQVRRGDGRRPRSPRRSPARRPHARRQRLTPSRRTPIFAGGPDGRAIAGAARRSRKVRAPRRHGGG